MPGLASLLRGRTTNPRKIRRPTRQVPTIPPEHSNIPVWSGTPGSVLRTPPPGGKTGGYVGSYQIGGEVGVSPEEVEMAAEIYAMATPEQQAQITGGGGGPGMMDEEAAIGEALAMAMGGGGGPPMNGGPPMGGMI